MNKRTKATIAAISVICLTLLIGAMSITYAWFTLEHRQQTPLIYGTGKVEGAVYFVDSANNPSEVILAKNRDYTSADGSKVTMADNPNGTDSGSIMNPDGTVSIELTDATQPNYYKNLRIQAVYSGQGRNYLRVGVYEFWTRISSIDGSEIVARMPPMKLTMAEGTGGTSADGGTETPPYSWIDTRSENLDKGVYVYYYNPDNTITEPEGATTYDYSLQTDKTLTIPIIQSVEDLGFAPPQGMKLKIAINLQFVQWNRYSELWEIQEMPTPQTEVTP